MTSRSSVGPPLGQLVVVVPSSLASFSLPLVLLVQGLDDREGHGRPDDHDEEGDHADHHRAAGRETSRSPRIPTKANPARPSHQDDPDDEEEVAVHPAADPTRRAASRPRRRSAPTAPHGLVGELERVSPPDQQAQGALALPLAERTRIPRSPSSATARVRAGPPRPLPPAPPRYAPGPRHGPRARRRSGPAPSPPAGACPPRSAGRSWRRRSRPPPISRAITSSISASSTPRSASQPRSSDSVRSL